MSEANRIIPDPKIVAYRVEYYAVQSDPYTGKQALVLTGHEVVNTVDIQDKLHIPNSYLAGWQEEYYYYKYERHPSGLPVETLHTYYKDQTHPINTAILKDAVTYIENNPQSVFNSADYRSMERILFELGWDGEMAVKQDESLPHITSSSMWDRFLNTPEIMRVTKNPIKHTSQTQNNVTLPPSQHQKELVDIGKEAEGYTVLSCKLDRLIDLIGTLVNEKYDSTGTSQPLPPRSEHAGRVNYNLDSNAPSSDTVNDQQSQTVSIQRRLL